MVKGFDERRREYLVEMMVQQDCPLIGKSVEEAGLRKLPGLFLIEINRSDQLITPVTPRDVHSRRGSDGVHRRGGNDCRPGTDPRLAPSADSSYEVQPEQRTRRVLTEAVLSRTSPLIGRTVKEAAFRQRYNAAIVAVHRNGERLTNKIGNIRLEPGDTLLLQTRSDFGAQHRNNRDFYLVSAIGGSSARRHDRAFGRWWIVSVADLLADCGPSLAVNGLALPFPFGNLLANKPQAMAAIAIVLAMIGARCLNTAQARAAIDLQVLITIAAAIGLGGALRTSGAADWLACGLVNFAIDSPLPEAALPWALLAVVYVTSMVLTETITNVAVASLMIPLSIRVAAVSGLSPTPFIMSVAVARRSASPRRSAIRPT